ncbi:Calx-beta domain-containing protein [Proteiniphilum sp. UBA5384]|uniref:Calx-beta domain-containing protein n=1 Tax=Proteiniphilum sp. UBA5384 TaxID=1947279 RepID=UPI0025FB9F64|nr:Calx-beta domain-containing protein [Proteiniphilum sp. UBA5384]
MNKFFLTAAIALVSVLTFVSCSDEDDAPVVSLEKSEYVMEPTGSVTVRLTVKNHNGSAVKVPFTLSGTAVKDEHYTISASEFVFSGSSSTADVVLIAKDNYEESRTIELNLGTLPAGFNMGSISKTTITVQPKDDIVYTFQKKKESLFSGAAIVLKLGTASSSLYRVEETVTIPIVVDAAGSTAVEGEHYEFTGAKSVTIEKGKSEGTVALTWLKTEEGKNTIKLGVGSALPAGFFPGQNINVTITIVGPVAGTLQGKWAGIALVNKEWMELNTGFDDDPEVYPLPETSDKDIIEFTSDEDGTPFLKTSFQGVLKNYFRDCTIEYKNEVTERLQEEGWPTPVVNILMVDLEKANVNFSATKEKIRKTEIGFRTFEKESQTILEVTLNDLEPTDFLQNTYNMVKDWGDSPVMKGYPLRYHFVKVAE